MNYRRGRGINSQSKPSTVINVLDIADKDFIKSVKKTDHFFAEGGLITRDRLKRDRLNNTPVDHES